MSATYQPTGFQSNGVRGNAPYEAGITRYNLTTNNTYIMGKGDAVSIAAGSIVSLTAAPAAGTLSANTPIGVVIGFEYQSPSRGLVCSDILQASAVSAGMFTNIQVLVNDEINSRFVLQYNGSITAAMVGTTCSFAGFNAADANFKVSRMYGTGQAGSGTTTNPLRILGIAPTLNNAAGDAYTQILVSWNSATHYFSQAGSN